jgi:LmbE family N-acetylglucosaminyl deacetylase
MEPLDITDPPSPVLVVVAHPDDIDFGTAGTVATLTAAGAAVTYCLVTSGEAGAPDEPTRTEVGALREREQRAAAAEVGVSDVRFLGHPDGAVVASIELRKDISRVIRQVRPQVIITQSPERNYDSIFASHPDHLAAAEACVSAAYPDAMNPHAHTTLLHDEGLEPHKVKEVWISFIEPQDVVIDITDQFDRKVAALSAHESQTSGFNREELLRAWSTDRAAKVGLPEGRLAETFRRINIS